MLQNLELTESVLAEVIPDLIRKDFLVFCKLELGLDISEMHKVWADTMCSKKDFLIIAPRDHGKLLSDSTEIYVEGRGWITHGEVKVGDNLLHPNGHYTSVLGISPPSLASLLISFSNGVSVVAHPLHEWDVIILGKRELVETRHLPLLLLSGLSVFLPPLSPSLPPSPPPPLRILNVSPTTPEIGRCLQVDSSDGLYLITRSLIPTHNSHFVVRAYAIFNAKYNDFVKDILIIGVDTSSAIDNLDKIKILMNSRPSLSLLLPRDRKRFNTRAEIKLENDTVLKAKAFSSAMRGRHPQLILLDDILNEINSHSEELRKKVRTFFFSVIYPMKDKGTESMRKMGYAPQVGIVGTVQNENDLYFDLMKNDSFLSIRQSALLSEVDKKVLWPQRYSYSDLMKIKAAVGSLVFSKEYCNEPLQDESALFPYSLFDSLKDTSRSYLHEYKDSNPIYYGVDFSVPGTTHGDYTVAVVGEKLPGETLILVGFWRERPLDIKRQIEKITSMCNLFKVTLGNLESNLFQRIYSEHFKNETSLPLRGHVVTASGKNSLFEGVLSFRALFENRKFIFPYKTDVDKAITDLIISEFTGMVRKDGKLGNFRNHDDCVMAMWHMWKASRTVKFSYSM